jgi:hypothetical protein
VAISALLTGGCAIVGEPAAEKVADGIDTYCTKESYTARAMYRMSVNEKLVQYGHTIHVYCAGDPEDIVVMGADTEQ